MEDGNHLAKYAFDDNLETSWASSPGKPSATFTIYYAKERTINEIKIIWKYPPLAFDISFYKQEWGVLYRTVNNKNFELLLQFPPRNV